MVVYDYELNLSLQEYFYFQECPQKFRLYRILNPLPMKNSFQTTKRTISEYILRGYNETELEGIKLHQFFATFHQLYAYCISKGIIPPEIKAKKELLNFWNYQQQRYITCRGTYYWKPLYTELALMTKKQRGIVDCLEIINENGDLRLIDYKKSQNSMDFEALQFYALLVEEFMIENNWEDLTLKEVGCYYYSIGKLEVQPYPSGLKKVVENKIQQILQKIEAENFFLKKESCAQCQLRMICHIDQGEK